MFSRAYAPGVDVLYSRFIAAKPQHTLVFQPQSAGPLEGSCHESGNLRKGQLAAGDFL